MQQCWLKVENQQQEREELINIKMILMILMTIKTIIVMPNMNLEDLETQVVETQIGNLTDLDNIILETQLSLMMNNKIIKILALVILIRVQKNTTQIESNIRG